MPPKQAAVESLNTASVLSHSSKRGYNHQDHRGVVSSWVLRQLRTKEITAVNGVSFNVLFRPFGPFCIGLILGICKIHSLAYAFVKKGRIAPDLSAIATVPSKNGIQRRSVRVRWVRGWRSVSSYPHSDSESPLAFCQVNVVGRNSRSQYHDSLDSNSSWMSARTSGS